MTLFNELMDAPNFSLSEFASKDTGYVKISRTLPGRVQGVRDYVNLLLARGNAPIQSLLDEAEFKEHEVYRPLGGWWQFSTLRGPGSVPLRINSACRGWSSHTSIYQDMYGHRQWLLETPLHSRHLIEQPDFVYHRTLRNRWDNEPAWVRKPDRDWRCCAVDLQRPPEIPSDVFEQIMRKCFTFVYKMSDTAWHGDERQA